MKNLLLLCAITALFIGSCVTDTETELTDEQKTAIQSEVGAEFEKLGNSILELNYDSWVEFWSRNDFISMETPRIGIITDFDTWSDSVKVSFTRRVRHNHEIQDLLITPLSQDLALVNQLAIWENWWENGNYRKTLGVTTLLYKKEEDGWKIIHGTEAGQLLEEELAE